MTTPEPGSFFFGGATDALNTSTSYLGDLLREPGPSENTFFGENPNVAGMATDDERVVLNPNLSPQASKSVFLNEASRLLMRQEGTPNFDLTPGQRANFAGTPYENASPEDQRGTILGRILSGDPSAGDPDFRQRAAAEVVRRRLFQWDPESPEARARSIAGGGGMEAAPDARLHPVTGRPLIRNPDGSVSSERGITITDDALNQGRPTNIPSIWDGRQLSEREAVQRAVQSGQAFPHFDTIDEAVQASIEHSRMLGLAGQVPTMGMPDQNDILLRNALRAMLGRRGP